MTGGLQCGFCTPGIVVAAKRLLDTNPAPTRGQIAEALNNHVCRCTGYVKIVDAIETAARALRGRTAAGGRLQRRARHAACPARTPSASRSAIARSSTTCAWTACCDGAFLFSPHPRARVLRIDTSEAARQPGVVRVVTAADVPGERYQGLIDRDWPLFVAEGEVTHCIGDILAAVVADTERHARQAIERIRVDYEPLPGVFSTDAALAPDAPSVHPGRDNLLSRSAIVRGDVDAALASSAFVETRTFTTQRIEHAFLEPEACLAVPRRDRGSGFGTRSGRT